ATRRPRRTARTRRAARGCRRSSAVRAERAIEWPAPSCDDLIALASARADRGLGARLLDLAPQPLDVDVDDVRQRIVVLVPHVLGDVASAHDVAGAPREVLEKRVLLGGEHELARADERAADARVERQGADRDPLGQKRQARAAGYRAPSRPRRAES